MTPKISIIISTYNRCENLKGILESLLKQQGIDGIEREVIVVDNNSTDQTKSVAEDFQLRFQGKMRYIFESQQGISFARNRGIREAQGEFVVFTDDDCLPDPKWLNVIFECFKRTQCDAIGGRILPEFPLNTPKWAEQSKDLLRGPIVFHDYGEEIKLYEKSMIEFVGANMAFRREVFQKYGYFRTDLGVGQGRMGDETDFFQRLQNHECKIYYCGKAVVWHPVDVNRLKLKYLAKWYMGLGRYRFLVDEKGMVDKGLVCYFGVPQYLIREILQHGVMLMVNIFRKRKFLQEWENLNIKLGRAYEMRRICRANAMKETVAYRIRK